MPVARCPKIRNAFFAALLSAQVIFSACEAPPAPNRPSEYIIQAKLYPHDSLWYVKSSRRRIIEGEEIGFRSWKIRVEKITAAERKGRLEFSFGSTARKYDVAFDSTGIIFFGSCGGHYSALFEGMESGIGKMAFFEKPGVKRKK